MHTAARRGMLAAAFCLLLVAGLVGGSLLLRTTHSSPSSTATSPSEREPAASPSASDGPETRVDAVLAGLDRRARVAQLFVVGVPLDDLGSGAALVESGVGGVFLAGRSDGAAADLAATTAQWQDLAPGPRLWVAADQEGGAVQSLRGPGFDRLPSALEQGRLPAGELEALATGMGAALRAAGINLDLAPVADVVPAGTEAGNEPIGAFDRHYGTTAAEVTTAAGAVIDGLAASGVTATVKHFPGLGRVEGNTDTSAGVTDTVTTAGDEQVGVFARLLRSPARPFAMMSSATYTHLDPANQAAFSPAVVTDLLRDRLGFDGVVISDDVGNTAAVRAVPPGERAVRFLGAGGTLVLTLEPDVVPPMIDAVLARSVEDPAFAAAVDRAVRTALTAKERAGLLPES